MTSDPPSPLDTTAPDGDRAEASARPERVSHYRLGALLGAGGMGVVYRAVDEKLGRAVAIKFLTAERGDLRARARFSREARAASALDHPNIGTVYEIGESDGRPFIVMALYEGETLRARISRGAISIDEISAIARQLCGALAAAHAAGIVHRDLKPANVMLLGDGTVKLLDFGLAKLISTDESSLTREGSILGTLGYMAPEQLKTEDIDARADLWALGAVLYEMLSGRPPFGSGPAATIVTRILHEQPPALPSAVPAPLAAVAISLLQKERADRLGPAAKVGELLASGEAPAQLLPRRQRRLLLTSLAVIAAFIASVTIIIARVNDSEPPPAAPSSLSQRAKQLEAQYEHDGDPSLLFDAAEAYYQAGDRKSALVLYQSYRQRMPRGTHDNVAADRIWELNVDNWPEPSPSPTRLAEQGRQRMEEAQRKFDVGKYEEAARLYESAYDVTKDHWALFQVAQSYERAGQKRLALMYYEAYQRSAAGAEPEDTSGHIESLRRQLAAPPVKGL